MVLEQKPETERIPAGYAGKLLRVDLTSGRIWTQELEAEYIKKWLGGAGFGIKILYDEVPPEVTWDHPENRLILATGPLAGTSTWGTGTMSAVFRGTLTGGASSTQANGFFGANLKSCGYDGIVIQGQSDKWVYLYIYDDDVRLFDASHVLGLDTWEVQHALWNEWGLTGHQMSVYGIGPAGENLVRFAGIAGDFGHVGAKNGSGCVMGKKKLKCVAICRGSRGVRVADPTALWQIADEISNDLRTDPSTKSLYEYGTLPGVVGLSAIGALPIKNYTTNVYPDQDALQKFAAPVFREAFEHRGHQCSACGMRHCHMQVIPEGKYKGALVDEPEYEGLSGCGATIGCTDPIGVTWLNTQVDRACVDVNEFGWVIGWVMECLEKGYLTKEQVGLDVPWGDAEAANQLLQLINHREGFGDILADGVKAAAERIGGPAYDAAIFTEKGAAPRGHDHRGRWEELLDTCVGSTGTLQTGPLVRPSEVGLPARRDPFGAEDTALSVAKGMGRRDFEDSIGACIFTTRTKLETVARAVTATTGMQIGFDEAMHIGRRIANLFRAFNVRSGIGPESEKPSPRYWSTPHDGPAAGKAIRPVWDEIVDLYYRTNGWDRVSGRPLPETLRQYQLDDVAEALWGKEAQAT